jgi:DNA-binding transcriptional regulator YdaS (Cro superfamily)
MSRELQLLQRACKVYGTQAAVAKKLGTRSTQARVSNWLTGKTALPPEIKSRLRELELDILAREMRESPSFDKKLELLSAALACSFQQEEILRASVGRLEKNLADARWRIDELEKLSKGG